MCTNVINDIFHGRFEHFTLRIAHRNIIQKFYVFILGMKILRHEEFSSGDPQYLNGIWMDPWSRTLVGYGPEETHFALELVFNYGINEYKHGNENQYRGVTIRSREAILRAKSHKWPIHIQDGIEYVEDENGYKFFLLNEPQPELEDPVVKVTLASSHLPNSTLYWNGTIGMKIEYMDNRIGRLSFNHTGILLEFVDIGRPIVHDKAKGRIHVSVPEMELADIDNIIMRSIYGFKTPCMPSFTDNKASVPILVLYDPDRYVVSFVGVEQFRLLSVVDPNAGTLLQKYINEEETMLANLTARKLANWVDPSLPLINDTSSLESFLYSEETPKQHRRP